MQMVFFEVHLTVVVALRQQLVSLLDWGLASGTESLCGDVDALASCAGSLLWSIKSQDTPKPTQLSSARAERLPQCPGSVDRYPVTRLRGPGTCTRTPSPAPKRNPTLRWDWLTSQVQVSLAGPGVAGLALNPHGPQLSHLATSPLFSRRPSACILPFPIFPSLSPKGQEHGQRLPPLPFLS